MTLLSPCMLNAFCFTASVSMRFSYTIPRGCPVLLRVMRLLPAMLVTLLIKPDTSGIAPTFALVLRAERSPVVSTVRGAAGLAERDELRVVWVAAVVGEVVDVAREVGELRPVRLGVQGVLEIP